jgi:hypothetical protein
MTPRGATCQKLTRVTKSVSARGVFLPDPAHRRIGTPLARQRRMALFWEPPKKTTQPTSRRPLVTLAIAILALFGLERGGE